jgi:hypothetical protein
MPGRNPQTTLSQGPAVTPHANTPQPSSFPRASPGHYTRERMRPGAWRRPRGGPAQPCWANRPVSAKTHFQSLPASPHANAPRPNTFPRASPGHYTRERMGPGAWRRLRGGPAQLRWANRPVSAKNSPPPFAQLLANQTIGLSRFRLQRSPLRLH